MAFSLLLIFFAYFLLLFFLIAHAWSILWCMVDTMGAKASAKVVVFFDMSDHKIVGGCSTLLAKVNKK